MRVKRNVCMRMQRPDLDTWTGWACMAGQGRAVVSSLASQCASKHACHTAWRQSTRQNAVGLLLAPATRAAREQKRSSRSDETRAGMHVSQASRNGRERERSREPCSTWRQRAKAERHETNDPSALYSPGHVPTYVRLWTCSLPCTHA
jgi:hypothetical protein